MTSLLLTLALASTAQGTAKELVQHSIDVMGGREKLSSIRQLTVTFTGHSYLVEQSERPTGPFLVNYSKGTRTYDFDKLSENSEVATTGLVFGGRELKRTYLIEKGTGQRSLPAENAESLRRLVLGPERVLLYAQAAPNLAMGKDAVLSGSPHSVVSFTWGRIPVRLYINKNSGMPAAVETVGPLQDFWNIWGDVSTLTRWSTWQVLENGIQEPTQWTTEINGFTVRDETLMTLKATFAPGSAVFAEPSPVIPADPKPMLARYKPSEIVKGITQYQGPFNTFVIEQEDGLVVIEPVLNSGFATAFLDTLKTAYPTKKVKAVIASDDAWPHFGGIRAFASRGSDLYVLDLNQPIVQRLLDARHTTSPDELALHPSKPRYRLIGKPTAIGTGSNRMVAYPIKGQGSERMMMVYFPQHKLLYGSDLLQKQGDGFFFAQYPKELRDAVVREGLQVETVFAEHLPPTPWSVVTGFVDKIMGKQ